MAAKKILLIDDEKSLLSLMKRYLERGGEYEVTTADSGARGIQEAEAGTFDLVITDFRMPDMDGGAVAETIKARKPDLPVLLFSIYHDDAQTITPDVEGKSDGLIGKPVDHDKFHKIIEEALARRDKKVT